MAVADKIKALMSIRGKKNIDLAKYLGMSAQALQNKLFRGSFSAEDLIKIGNFLDCTLNFQVDDKQKIIFDMSDLRSH